MTFTEIATRIDYLSAHQLEHAVELERQAHVSRLSRPRKEQKRVWPVHVASSPIERSIGVVLI